MDNILDKDNNRGRERSVQSIDRAVAILETIARSRGEMTLTEICDASNLNTSTCHHILKTLMAHNFVRPGTARGRYMLGSQLVILADAVNIKAELPSRARAVLDGLNRVTEEAVHLAVLDRDKMITLMKREARHALRVDHGSIGKSTALHATATGKILLSDLGESEVRRIMTLHGMERYTSNTCTDMDQLLEEIAQVRSSGFSEDREEFQLYVVCIGAAVRDTAGHVVAAISVSTPINRATEKHLAFVRRELAVATKTLSLPRLQPDNEVSK